MQWQRTWEDQTGILTTLTVVRDTRNFEINAITVRGLGNPSCDLELWRLPALRTQADNCPYAHSEEDLRSTDFFYKKRPAANGCMSW